MRRLRFQMPPRSDSGVRREFAVAIANTEWERAVLGTARSQTFSSVAAAVAEQNAGEDDEPNPVVVKKLTNAVAVHMITLPFEIRERRKRPRDASAVAAVLPSCYHVMSNRAKCEGILSDFAEMNLCGFTYANKTASLTAFDREFAGFRIANCMIKARFCRMSLKKREKIV